MGFENLEFMDPHVMEGFLFEERKLLEMKKESHKIKKPLSSSQGVQYTRRPVIIHTYSPKVIQTEAHNFMQLVQKLTGWDRQHKDKKRKKNKSKNVTVNENLDTTFPDTSSCQWKKLELNAAEASSIEMWKNNHGSRNCHNHDLVEPSHINLRNEAPVMNKYVEEVSSSAPGHAAAVGVNSNTLNATMDLMPLLDGSSHYISSQSLHYPCKRGTNMDISQNYYDNPCQDPLRFVENLGCSSPTPIADTVYNISDLLPQFFTRDFEYQHLL